MRGFHSEQAATSCAVPGTIRRLPAIVVGRNGGTHSWPPIQSERSLSRQPDRRRNPPSGASHSTTSCRPIRNSPRVRPAAAKVAMFAIAIAVVLGAVFYGLNNSTRQSGRHHAADVDGAEHQPSPPAAPPGMRDVTPEGQQPSRARPPAPRRRARSPAAAGLPAPSRSSGQSAGRQVVRLTSRKLTNCAAGTNCPPRFLVLQLNILFNSPPG